MRETVFTDEFYWSSELGQSLLTSALENGFECKDIEDNRETLNGIGGRLGLIQFWSSRLGEWGGYYEPQLVQAITNHDFAKAVFGETWKEVVTAFVLSDDREAFMEEWKAGR